MKSIVATLTTGGSRAAGVHAVHVEVQRFDTGKVLIHLREPTTRSQHVDELIAFDKKDAADLVDAVADGLVSDLVEAHTLLAHLMNSGAIDDMRGLFARRLARNLIRRIGDRLAAMGAL